MATPRTWVVGETVTAAQLNAEIRDQFNSIFAAWVDYTPTWTADTGTTTLGNGILEGRYRKVGRTVDFVMRFDWGTTTSQSISGANWNFALPAAAYSGKGNTWHVIDAWVFNASDGGGSSSRWRAAGYINATAQTVQAITVHADGGFMDDAEMPRQATAGGGTTTVQPSNEAWVSGDRINIWGVYEAAA